MALYAIGDLHFSPQNNKPMDIFGWKNHKEKILDYWLTHITEKDVVIIAGDISWAMKYTEAIENLDEINTLPGKKILLRGNHDFWWQSLSKMQKEYPQMFFLQNNCYEDDQYLVFGTRGWDLPGSNDFTESDKKIYEREKLRLQLSFDFADSEAEKQEEKTRIVAMHYPPVIENQKQSEITSLMEQNDIKHMVYGHLHGAESFKNVFEGNYNGTNYHLVSADYLEFKIKKIID